MNKFILHLLLSFFFISCDLISGNDKSIDDTALNSNLAKDFEGHVYDTVKIGNQIWTTEDLQTTHFLNGDEIQEAKSLDEWYDCFLKKQPCFKRTENGIIYNGFVVQDKRELVKGDFFIPTLNDFVLLRKKLGKNADQKLAVYEWEEWSTSNYEESGEDVQVIKGNNQSGFNARKSLCIYAPFIDQNQEAQSAKVVMSSNQIPAWFWTKTKGSCIDCFGYRGSCFQSIMIGRIPSFTCDEPNEGPVNYAYGLNIRLVKKDEANKGNHMARSLDLNNNTMIGYYTESKGYEYFEKLDGVDGLAHWIEGEIIFNVEGKKVAFIVHQDTEEGFEANGIKSFWSKNPRVLEQGAHGSSYDFSNTTNVGKKYKLY